jgi:hypothetical protein
MPTLRRTMKTPDPEPKSVIIVVATAPLSMIASVYFGLGSCYGISHSW